MTDTQYFYILPVNYVVVAWHWLMWKWRGIRAKKTWIDKYGGRCYNAGHAAGVEEGFDRGRASMHAEIVNEAGQLRKLKEGL